MSEHTKTPWRVDTELGTTLGSILGVVNSEEMVIAQTQQTRPVTCFEDHAERIANAEFIVRACNAHDVLVKAAQSAAQLLAAMDKQTSRFCMLVNMKRNRLREALSALALAAAEGKQ